MDAPGPQRIYQFGDFELDAQLRRVYRIGNSEPLPITARAFDTLLYLVEHRNRLVEKSELLAAVWPTVVVEENNLATTVHTLRRLLGESPGEHRYIVTVSRGRGTCALDPAGLQARAQRLRELRAGARRLVGCRRTFRQQHRVSARQRQKHGPPDGCRLDGEQLHWD